MTIAEAREFIRQSFEDDPDFRRGYQDNIAMLLHDRHGITEIDARNAAADDILKLVFGSDRDSSYMSPQFEILLQAFGEAAAMFMSRPEPGIEIVMPDRELKELAERTDALIRELEV